MSGADSSPGVWRHLGRALGLVEQPRENPGGAVYGLISIGVVLAAEAGSRETYARTLEAAVITLVLYWLAHTYAHLYGLRLSEGADLTPRVVTVALVREVSILRGAVLPVIALLLSWAAGASLSTAITVDLWVCAVGIFLFETAAALQSRLRSVALVLETALSAGMGLSILVLRVVLH